MYGGYGLRADVDGIKLCGELLQAGAQNVLGDAGQLKGGVQT